MLQGTIKNYQILDYTDQDGENLYLLTELSLKGKYPEINYIHDRPIAAGEKNIYSIQQMK